MATKTVVCGEPGIQSTWSETQLNVPGDPTWYPNYDPAQTNWSAVPFLIDTSNTCGPAWTTSKQTTRWVNLNPNNWGGAPTPPTEWFSQDQSMMANSNTIDGTCPNPNHLSVNWDGFFYAPVEGEYDFMIQTPNAMDVYIDLNGDKQFSASDISYSSSYNNGSDFCGLGDYYVATYEPSDGLELPTTRGVTAPWVCPNNNRHELLRPLIPNAGINPVGWPTDYYPLDSDGTGYLGDFCVMADQYGRWDWIGWWQNSGGWPEPPSRYILDVSGSDDNQLETYILRGGETMQYWQSQSGYGHNEFNNLFNPWAIPEPQTWPGKNNEELNGNIWPWRWNNIGGLDFFGKDFWHLWVLQNPFEEASMGHKAKGEVLFRGVWNLARFAKTGEMPGYKWGNRKMYTWTSRTLTPGYHKIHIAGRGILKYRFPEGTDQRLDAETLGRAGGTTNAAYDTYGWIDTSKIPAASWSADCPFSSCEGGVVKAIAKTVDRQHVTCANVAGGAALNDTTITIFPNSVMPRTQKTSSGAYVSWNVPYDTAYTVYGDYTDYEVKNVCTWETNRNATPPVNPDPSLLTQGRTGTLTQPADDNDAHGARIFQIGLAPAGPWLRAVGGDVHANSDLVSLVPNSASPLPRVFLSDGTHGAGGVVSWGGTTFDVAIEDTNAGKNIVSTNNWLAEDVSYPVKSRYEKFTRRVDAPGALPYEPTNGNKPGASGIYYVGGSTENPNLTIDAAWDVDTSIIMIVPGNLTINAPVTISGTGFIAFIVKGGIAVGGSVGGTYDTPGISGIYVADGTFTIAAGTDPLVVKGSVAVKTVETNRTLAANTTTPVVSFIWDEELMFRMPRKLLDLKWTWDEVNP